MKLYLIIPALLIAGLSLGQQPFRISLTSTTLAATDSLMPFWLSANRDGKIRPAGRWLHVTELYAEQPYREGSAAFSPTWGVNAVAGFSDRNYYQLNQAFGGMSWKGWELKGGLFIDPEQVSGLSSSNGNLGRSRNARPHPRLRFSTRGYKPVPFLREHLHFRAEYDEGLLNDDRFVDKTRLHHKSFYLRLDLPARWQLEGGLEHFVMWGGRSPVEAIGNLPAGLKHYLQYITGSSGDDSFPVTDRLNVAGNQLGTYQFRATKQFPVMEATFYLSHPFEDLSGMNWRNWPDNLLGLHFSFSNKQQLVTDVVYEFTHTRQQSIRGAWDRQEPDGYFNNGVYRSGFTYHGQVMGSPLFFPVVLKEGVSQGIESNLFFAHHAGIKGVLSPTLRWKGMLTGIRHFGSYFSRYVPSRRQVSGLLEVNYSSPRFPVELGLAAAADAGNYSGRNSGIQFVMRREF